MAIQLISDICRILNYLIVGMTYLARPNLYYFQPHLSERKTIKDSLSKIIVFCFWWNAESMNRWNWMAPFFFPCLGINTFTNFQKPCHEWSSQSVVVRNHSLQLANKVIPRVIVNLNEWFLFATRMVTNHEWLLITMSGCEDQSWQFFLSWCMYWCRDQEKERYCGFLHTSAIF